MARITVYDKNTGRTRSMPAKAFAQIEKEQMNLHGRMVPRYEVKNTVSSETATEARTRPNAGAATKSAAAKGSGKSGANAAAKSETKGKKSGSKKGAGASSSKARTK